MSHETRLQTLVESVARLVRRGAQANLRKLYDKTRAEELAYVFSHLPRFERRNAFRIQYEHDFQKAAETLTELPIEMAVTLLESMQVEAIDRLLRVMSPDDAAEFVGALPEALRDELLATMDAREHEDVHELLNYPSETAGRIMTPNVFALKEDVTVGEAISRLQRASEELEMVFYIYVVDERNHLVGVVSLRQLLQNLPGALLKDIMFTEVISVRTHTDQEEVAREVARYNLLAIPVVDDENKLAGIVTVDDVIDVIRDEATEDIFALAGVDADDRALGRPLRSFRRRLPWLIGSLLTLLLVSKFVIGPFEEQGIFTDIGALAVLLPLVAAMGGHAATQTLTVIVRGLSTGEVTGETRRRAFFKEVVVGLLNGVVIGLLAAVITSLFFEDGIKLGGIMFLSLMGLMVCAACIGTVIPLTLKLLNFDPAIASGIFVMTITDILGYLSFLGLAYVLLVRASTTG